MALVEITPDPARTKNYFGSIHKTVCAQLVTTIPEQILGAIPVKLEDTDCFDICYEPCFIENDQSGFLFKFPSSQFDDEYKLEKWDGSAWQEVVTGNPDNVLGIESGTKFNLGFDTNYSLYGGFLLNWGLIYSNDGAGRYRFVVDNSDPDNKLYSIGINLKADTCENKKGTVYIKFESYGRFENYEYTESNGLDKFFDLINLSTNWVDGCRYEARIELAPYETEITNVKFADFSNKLQYSEERSVYNLILFRVSHDLFSRLYLYGLNSFGIQLSDGNSDAPLKLEQVDAVKDGSNEFEKYVNNQLIYNVNIQLKSKYDLGYKTC